MKVNRLELIKALEAVMPGLAAKDVVEQATAFAFRDGRVHAYNDQVAVSHPCPPGLAGAVRAQELHALLKRLADDEIDVEAGENELLVKGKRAKASLVLQAEITLPLDEVGGRKVWKTLPDGFTAAVKFVLFSAGGDMTKPELTAVHVVGRTVETCDNFRLTRWQLGKREKFDGELMLPAAAAAELVKYEPTHWCLTTAKDDKGDVPAWAHFTNKAGAEFSCRLVAGEFPDLQPFVDQKWKHKIAFHEDTAAILDRAQVFLAGDKAAHPTVDVKVSSGRMIVAAKGIAGWFEETVRVEASKESFAFTINPQALHDMLPLLRDSELNEDGSVLKFEGDNFIHCCSTVVAGE